MIVEHFHQIIKSLRYNEVQTIDIGFSSTFEIGDAGDMYFFSFNNLLKFIDFLVINRDIFTKIIKSELRLTNID